MAEEKKDVKKEVKKDDKKPSGGVVWEEVILLILGIVALLFVFIPRFLTNKNIVTSDDSGGGYVDIGQTVNNFLGNNIVTGENPNIVNNTQRPSRFTEVRSELTDYFKNIMVIVFSTLIFLSLLFSAAIYYNKFRRQLIIANYKKKLEPEPEKDIEERNQEILEKLEPDNNGIINPRWQTVGKYYNSANQSDWKLAIMEADIMLYDVLDKSGFSGDTIGEMLKNTDRSKLETLDLAWSAHKVRNEIAHQGLDYVLSRSKVEEAIGNYEKVFDELNFI
jgi:hypothetical protein